MKPPFIGFKSIDVEPRNVRRLIDLNSLFIGRWQFKRESSDKAWTELKETKILPIYNRIWNDCASSDSLTLSLAYGFFRCEARENAIIISHNEKAHRFEFPRELKPPHRCLSDFFEEGFATFQLAALGNKIGNRISRLFAENRYSDSFYMKGLAAETAEALAEYGQRHIASLLGLDESSGIRYSPGYPAFPDLFANKKIAYILNSKSMGVSVTETCMFTPEHATSAIISFSPNAARFNPTSRG